MSHFDARAGNIYEFSWYRIDELPDGTPLPKIRYGTHYETQLIYQNGFVVAIAHLRIPELLWLWEE